MFCALQRVYLDRKALLRFVTIKQGLSFVLNARDLSNFGWTAIKKRYEMDKREPRELQNYLQPI
jgi:hypothetical protein